MIKKLKVDFKQVKIQQKLAIFLTKCASRDLEISIKLILIFIHSFCISANNNKTDAPAVAPTNLFGAASFGGTTTTSQAASTPFATTGFGTPSTNLLASATSQPKESAPAPAAGLFGAPAAAAPVSNAGEI